MCIGIPMQIAEAYPGYAVCHNDSGLRKVNTLMVGEHPAGTWLLVFLDSAREVLSEIEARRILDGLKAVQMVLSGNMDVDHLFADLVDREPQIPAFLKNRV